MFVFVKENLNMCYFYQWDDYNGNKKRGKKKTKDSRIKLS